MEDFRGLELTFPQVTWLGSPTFHVVFSRPFYLAMLAHQTNAAQVHESDFSYRSTATPMIDAS